MQGLILSQGAVFCATLREVDESLREVDESLREVAESLWERVKLIWEFVKPILTAAVGTFVCAYAAEKGTQWARA